MVRGNTISYGTGVLPDRDYPADPYPGAVPDCSFVHLDELSHPVRPDPTATTGWRVGDLGLLPVLAPDLAPGLLPGLAPDLAPDLDDWLAARDGAPLAARTPLLTYGSNRCPSKITWLRRELGLTGPVVVLRAATSDVAAVWAAGLRKRDGQRPAVLAAAPGVAEHHAIWMATAEQLEVLDRCEGRDDRYRLARPPITVRTEDGALIERPWCYLALGAIRQPLLVGGPTGSPVRCADLAQELARDLDGVPAPTDGLNAPTVTGAPRPEEWPSALFAHGPLQPGGAGWPLLAPHHHGTPRPARAPGTVFDTGLGRPAPPLDAVPHPGPRAGSVPGTYVLLRDPVAALAALDDHEGPGHRRIRLRLDDGSVAWAYLRRGDRSPW